VSVLVVIGFKTIPFKKDNISTYPDNPGNTEKLKVSFNPLLKRQQTKDKRQKTKDKRQNIFTYIASKT
jgi:hypothetical protein